MKLVKGHQTGDLETRLKHKFSEFNRTSSPCRGRKYPKDLRTLVGEALAGGMSPGTVRRLTGVSPAAMHKWARIVKSSASAASSPKTIIAPRRLEVVGSRPGQGGAIIVYLPSGVSIEFADAAQLNHDLLTDLATLEVSHASSR